MLTIQDCQTAAHQKHSRPLRNLTFACHIAHVTCRCKSLLFLMPFYCLLPFSNKARTSKKLARNRTNASCSLATYTAQATSFLPALNRTNKSRQLAHFLQANRAACTFMQAVGHAFCRLAKFLKPQVITYIVISYFKKQCNNNTKSQM